MKSNKKICFGCDELKYIWKNVSGKKYCKECSIKFNTPKTISKVSNKRKEQDKEYKLLVKQLLTERPYCEVKWSNCTYYSTQCHHSKGRVGNNYLDYSTFIAICHNCHLEVELNPIRAKQEGFSSNRLN